MDVLKITVSETGELYVYTHKGLDPDAPELIQGCINDALKEAQKHLEGENETLH